MRLSLLAMFVTLSLAPAAPALAQKPVVPPGIDPGGLAVAVLGPGVDYTRSEISRRLARDGEGELIGWDLADNDRRPYAASTGVALLNARASVPGPARTLRVIPVRVEPVTPAIVSSGLAFTAQTPARVAIVRVGAGVGDIVRLVATVAPRAPQLLIILDGAAPDDIVLPDNVLAVVPRPGEVAGSDAVLESLLGAAPAWLVSLVACDEGLRGQPTGAALKAALVARATDPGQAGAGCR